MVGELQPPAPILFTFFILSHAMENSSEYLVIGAMKMKNSFESQLKITERL
jgi:hypothetical protein